MIGGAALLLATSASSAVIGTAAGTCRPDEAGPAIMVAVQGLKDRTGLIRVELYPADDDDFLADDTKLIAAGKTFARVEMPMPPSGPVSLCIRVPHAGRYGLMLLHDRDSNRKFTLSTDGVGFPGDPRLGWSKPKVAEATIIAGAGLTPITITLNYRHGLLMRPLDPR